MKFSQSNADILVLSPNAGGNDGEPQDDADSRATTSATEVLRSVTHLCIAAHQDDIEVMAYDGICDCLENPTAFRFGGVVVTNGGGSPRSDEPYGACTDAQMQAIRREEQREAARLGGYAIQIQLGHPSLHVKAKAAGQDAAAMEMAMAVAADLDTILLVCTPRVLYLHQPADKHDTHVALFLRCLEALRRLPPERRPARVLGCEVWRGLDWLQDSEKVALNSGRKPDLAGALLRTFDSQITGGKRYDLAAAGRRLANATFHTPHATDQFPGITWAMDLTPLVADPTLDVTTFTLAHIDRLRHDVEHRLERYGSTARLTSAA